VKVVGGVVAAAVLLVGGGYLYVNHDYTECFAGYETKQAAERAAEDGRDAGFDVTVERRSEWSAIMTFGETGDDARDDRARFREILDETGGELGHPGEGCLERGPFI